MHSFPRRLRRLIAAAFVPWVAAWSLGGCNDTGFSDEDCDAALHRCDYFDVSFTCKYSPFQCTIGGKPYLDTEGAFYIPPNQTMTIDLSSEGFSERTVDLRFGLCGKSPQGSIEDFQIQLDGIDASAKAFYDINEDEWHHFPGHTGPPRKLELTWKGTVNGEIPASPPPKICVSLELEDRACVNKAFNRECYTPYVD